MLWVRRTLLFVLLSMLSVMGSRAEDKLAWLPDYFDRVTTLEELVDGAYYLVAGTSQRDGHVMMTGASDTISSRYSTKGWHSNLLSLTPNHILRWDLR